MTSFEQWGLTGKSLGVSAKTDEASCVSGCRGKSACVGAVYDRWNGRCTLFRVVTNRRLEPKGIATLFDRSLIEIIKSYSKLQQVRRKRFPDTPYSSRQTDNFDGCSKTCFDDDRCVAFNYSKSQWLCELLDSPTE